MPIAKHSVIGLTIALLVAVLVVVDLAVSLDTFNDNKVMTNSTMPVEAQIPRSWRPMTLP